MKAVDAAIGALGFQPAGATVERLTAALEPFVDASKLVGVRELATRYGVSRQAISNWTSWSPSTAHKGPGFPEPVARPSGVPVWDVAETDAWAARTGRTVKGDERGGRAA